MFNSWNPTSNHSMQMLIACSSNRLSKPLYRVNAPWQSDVMGVHRRRKTLTELFTDCSSNKWIENRLHRAQTEVIATKGAPAQQAHLLVAMATAAAVPITSTLPTMPVNVRTRCITDSALIGIKKHGKWVPRENAKCAIEKRNKKH